MSTAVKKATGRIRVQVTADVNIAAPVARRLVNTELMQKVGQMVMAGEAELLVDGQKVYWKVPLLVVPPDGDANVYPTGRCALVNAYSGIYVLNKKEVEALKSAARPLLYRLYPDLPEGWIW